MKIGFKRRPPSAAEESLQDALLDAARHAADHAQRHKLALFAFTGVFIGTSIFTAIGLFDIAAEAGTANPERMIVASMAAAVAALVLGIANILLLGLATVAVTQYRNALLVLALTLMPFTFGISTYSAALGLAGPPALVFDMRDAARAYGAFVETRLAKAAKALSTADALEPLKASLCTLADQEGSGGVLSGAAGRGGVQAAYLGACESVTTIIDTLRDTAQRTEARRAEALQIVKALKAIADDVSLNVYERQRRFRDTSEELLALVGASDVENVDDRLRAQLDILQASISGIGIQSGAFGQTQTNIINGLKASLGTATQIISGLLDKSDVTGAQVPDDLLFMAAAIQKYKLRVLPQILIAIASDLMPYWFFGLLLVSQAMVGAKNRRVDVRRRNVEAERRAVDCKTSSKHNRKRKGQ